MSAFLRRGPLAPLVVAAAVAFACGSSKGQGFAPSPDGDASSMDAGEDGGTFVVPDTGAFTLGDTGSSTGGMGTGVCKDGVYSGTFQCTFVFNPDAGDAGGGSVSADAGGLMITGNISFKLTQAMGNGESFIDTASGSFMGTAATFFAISADVGGMLNCNTGVFTGTLSNGMYSGFLFLNGTFSGPLNSQYNGTTFSFVDGTWLLTVPGEGACPGTWSANYASDQ